MKVTSLIFLFGLTSLYVFTGCTGKQQKHEEFAQQDEPVFSLDGARAGYNVMNYFSEDEIDTLMLNIVSYIGKKHPNSDQTTRFLPRWRSHFQSQVPSYEFVYYHVASDSTHYYYIRRPAISLDGNMRGAAGKFRLQRGLEIAGFVEVFVTPILDTPQLYITGYELFMELIEKGHIEKFVGDPDMIEWPDERLQYDTLTREWRYIRDL